jgi:hypothetical protein
VPPYVLYQDVVDPYQPVTLAADMMIKYDRAHRNLLVVYSNAVQYRLKDGTVRHTPLRTTLELARTMAGVRWQ